MRTGFLLIVLFFISFPALAQEREGDIAVMEMVFSGPGLIKTQVDSLSDLIRAKAVELTKYRVMTKENNLAILRDKKVDLARCADAECVIEFGRILKADKLVTSNLLLSEGTYYLTLKFYDVASASIDKVLDRECQACDFSKLRQTVKEAAKEILGGAAKPETASAPGFVVPGGGLSGPEETGVAEISPTQVAAAASGPAGLYITTSPSGADVYLGNLKAGNTEPAFQKTDLEPGKVIQVTLQKQDYHPLVFPVDLKPGVTKYEDLKLKPNFGGLEILSEPAGAKVEIGGEQVGTTPFRNERMKSGEYLVSVSLYLYDPVKNQTVLVVDEKKTVKSYPLSPNFGMVSVESDPAGAEVFVNNTDQGKTPGSIKLLPGRYELSLRIDGYHPKAFNLTVARGKQVAITREQGQLVQILGSLSVFADPPEPGAKVFLDGVESGNAPLTLTGIPAGNHEVTVKTKGKEGKKTVVIEDQKMASVTIKPVESGMGGMALIPAGEFMMGCNSAVDNKCGNDEKPYHRIYLDAYYIDKYEVTVSEYEKCVNAGKCSDPRSKSDNQYCNWGYSDRGNHPVNCVDWSQTVAYCESAGKRLPTEAEWEKAARGTDGRAYPYGNTFDCRKSCNSVKPCNHDSTCPVGSYAADKSPYGVMDMAGNVWEWVQDWYEEGYYKNSPAQNPQGPSSGSYRALRGGSWLNFDPGVLRASVRSRISPTYWNLGYGFRCVRRVE